MKKVYFAICLLCLTLCFCVSACGSTYAKIYGIQACIVLQGGDETYDSTLKDAATLEEDDYVLQVGESYDILVEYTAGGGSRYPVISDATAVTFKYNASALEIQTPMPNDGEVKRYALVCKEEISCSAILIELSEYSYTLIVTAVI